MSSYHFSKSLKSSTSLGIGSMRDSITLSSPAPTMKMSGPVPSAIVFRRSVLYLIGSVVFFSNMISVFLYSGAYSWNPFARASYPMVVPSVIHTLRLSGITCVFVVRFWSMNMPIMRLVMMTHTMTKKNIFFWDIEQWLGNRES